MALLVVTDSVEVFVLPAMKHHTWHTPVGYLAVGYLAVLRNVSHLRRPLILTANADLLFLRTASAMCTQ